MCAGRRQRYAARVRACNPTVPRLFCNVSAESRPSQICRKCAVLPDMFPPVQWAVLDHCTPQASMGATAQCVGRTIVGGLRAGPLTAHELLGVGHHGAEEALQGQLQVVVQVVLEIDGQVVLQRVDRILCLVVRLHPLGRLQFHVASGHLGYQPLPCPAGHIIPAAHVHT